MADWVDDIDLNAWETEPETVPEKQFTADADELWRAWNMWSAEVEVSDFAGVLIRELKPDTILETGMGQGYSTRRIIQAAYDISEGPQHPEVYVHEAEPRLREMSRDYFDAYYARELARRVNDYDGDGNYDRIPHVILQEEKDPTVEEIGSADFLWLDSHWPERFRELRLWAQNGKPGSYAFLHDAKRTAHPQSGHFQLANLISLLEIPTVWFDNPRGSALLFKPEGYICPVGKWPNAKQDVKDQGSVFVAQIDGGDVNGAYAHSMVKMMTYSMQYPGMVGGYMRRTGGPRIYAARDAIVRHFLANTDCDWLLQIDSDMVFHHTLLESMLQVADAQDRPIVAGHCYMNRGESGPLGTMWAEDPNGNGPTDVIHFENYPIGEMVEVAATGGACILIHRRVFETIQATDPNYVFPWYEETMNGTQPVGEDITFCIRARQHGFPVYVHTGLDIGHMKQIQIGHEYFSDFRRVRRFVIAAAPRSGTAYISDLLMRVGIPTGHERVYGLDDVPTWNMRWGDSSWLSVPHLQSFDGTLMHQVRHPLGSISSMMDHGLFDPDNCAEYVPPYMEFAKKHAFEEGEWESLTPLKRTMLFYARWNQRIMEARPNISYRVEDMNPDLLAEILRFVRQPTVPPPHVLRKNIEEVPTTTNRKNPDSPPERYTWDDLHAEWPEQAAIIEKMARAWGYED